MTHDRRWLSVCLILLVWASSGCIPIIGGLSSPSLEGKWERVAGNMALPVDLEFRRDGTLISGGSAWQFSWLDKERVKVEAGPFSAVWTVSISKAELRIRRGTESETIYRPYRVLSVTPEALTGVWAPATPTESTCMQLVSAVPGYPLMGPNRPWKIQFLPAGRLNYTVPLDNTWRAEQVAEYRLEGNVLEIVRVNVRGSYRSMESAHCEIMLTEGTLTMKDAGGKRSVWTRESFEPIPTSSVVPSSRSNPPATAAPAGASNRDARTVADEFMTLMKNSDYYRAYQLCSPRLQKELGGSSNFQHMIARGRVEPESWTWTNPNISRGEAEFTGRAKFKSGKSGTVKLNLEAVSNDWNVTGFNLKEE